MKKRNHLWEALLGVIIPIPTIFTDASIEIIKSDWPKTFFYRFLLNPLSIAGLKILNLLLILMGLIVFIDAIQGLFTEKSILPKIKQEILDFFN